MPEEDENKAYGLPTTNQPLKNDYKIQPFSVQYKMIELQCQLTQGECEYHKSLLTVRGDYKHEASYYEDFLKGMIFTGYGIIPGFGIILATVAKYMNNTGLACDGKSIIKKSRQEITRTVINIISDLVQIVLIIIGICLALTTENTVAYATIIAFYIFFFYFQLLDKQLQVAYGHTVDYYIKQVFCCTKITNNNQQQITQTTIPTTNKKSSIFCVRKKSNISLPTTMPQYHPATEQNNNTQIITTVVEHQQVQPVTENVIEKIK
ncbi:Hypothetical_protein [Hexamita inflata]|uniref:Hypothetical_protein n=1 Tax=Hexamita inflata TaxID=28002 RepID=A0AA86QZ59_9EUKA|nr:Hypothetical protein HINF_LOCUS50019 [Hexamita inflata]